MNEARTDRCIESAVRHANASSLELWPAAYQASKVYGLYKEAATSEIARQAGRSRGAVQKWVYGYRCFTACLQVNYELTKHYRRTFSLSHFATMQELSVRYDLKPQHMLYYFGVLSQYHKNGDAWSVEVLSKEIESGQWKRAADWRWYVPRIDNYISALLTFDGELPDEVKTWAQAWRVIGGEWR